MTVRRGGGFRTKAVPLMRMLKNKRTTPPGLNSAFGARLSAITIRGKVEEALYPPPHEPLKVEARQKRFWTPDEVAAASSGE